MYANDRCKEQRKEAGIKSKFTGKEKVKYSLLNIYWPLSKLSFLKKMFLLQREWLEEKSLEPP